MLISLLNKKWKKKVGKTVLLRWSPLVWLYLLLLLYPTLPIIIVVLIIITIVTISWIITIYPYYSVGRLLMLIAT